MSVIVSVMVSGVSQCGVSVIMGGVTLSEWYDCDGSSGVIAAVSGVTMNDVSVKVSGVTEPCDGEWCECEWYD